jgi:hypothetical protein
MSTTATAAITVLRPREEVERLWSGSEHRVEAAGVRFADAPGDRGTEIHLEIDGQPALAKAKDGLRRFKQQVETGVLARSEAVPEGETAERKAKTRPAQPLDPSELEKAGV